MSGRPARVSGLLRRLSARLERDRWEALHEPAADLAWQAGYCEGLAHARHVLRNGA